MKFGTIKLAGQPCLVMQHNNGGMCLVDRLLATADADSVGTMLDLVRSIGEDPALATALSAAAGSIDVEHILLEDDKTEWLPPIGNPSKILGVAFNNRELMKKAHHDPGVPNFFLKPPSCLIGHGKPIIVDPNWGAVIPEPEICAVIGRRAKHIVEADALNYVFGFMIHNDVTSHGLKFGKDSIAVTYDRDMARPEFYGWRNLHSADDTDAYYVYHTRSKGTDSFGPCGPWITLRDAVGDPNNLHVTGTIDGEVFTKDHTGNYRFSVEACIAEASRYFTLEPGDMISFGTTGKGVGRFPRGHKSLLLGETTGIVGIEIAPLGRLANPIMHQTGGA